LANALVAREWTDQGLVFTDETGGLVDLRSVLRVLQGAVHAIAADLLRVMAGQHKALNVSPKLAAILGEFNLIASAKHITDNNGWLLKLLHTTRALDTCLSEVIAYMGWNTQSSDPKGLGSYLLTLRKNGVLTEEQRIDYRRSLADKRNKYMHEAGAMPDKLEANSILNEMHSCLVVVLANV
jgi:hypothetical protein